MTRTPAEIRDLIERARELAGYHGVGDNDAMRVALSEAADALAPLAAERGEAGWQPWSSVPRDDDNVLATDMRIDGGFPQVVFWDVTEANGWHVPDADIRYDDGFFTHWRRDCLSPAPPAPAAMPGVVTDEMLVAAMRAFEPQSSILRYREKDGWHACDIAAMRAALLPLAQENERLKARVAEEVRLRALSEKQAGDLADGIIDAIGMQRLGSPERGYVNPDDKAITQAVAALHARALSVEQALAEAKGKIR